MQKCDFHTHSTASDGILTPTEIVQRAYNNNVKYLALTDHDTVSGINEAKKVAKAIVMHRLNSPIDTTSQLVEIIKNSVSKQTLHKVKHPARTYFQAIRIEVNDELNNLQNFINTAVKHLNHDGRLAIISYHSLN